MKKFVIYTLIIVVFSGVASVAIQTAVDNGKDLQTIHSAIEMIGPQMLFADDSLPGDSLGDGGGINPPPPPID